ncbi:MAG: 2Fe-2S iron-sulfur cluster binding domain-containing protein [Gammaproteobacteria bacterium]|nr:2Fe-2S iron-sulfur cluster binding domain-containing protein [Gammaproteobacteria bacterium]
MSHTVQVDPSGVEITVNEGDTILDAALGQGVALPHGCKGGACGACKCKVTSGEVYYDDDPMALSDEDAAEGYTLSCVTKVKGDVTIETEIEQPASEVVATVTLAKSGKAFRVEGGETVLDAALREGLALPYGCRGGACGACKGALISGEVSYDGEVQGLTDEEQAAGVILTCVAKPKGDLLLDIDLIESASEIKVEQFPAKIALMEKLSGDVMRLGLKLPEESRMQFLAGQYVEFIFEDGERRAFSIANAPHDDELLEFHVRHIEGGMFTDKLFNQMRPGDLMQIEGPMGSFFVREDSERPMILLATGTGFGPIKGIVEHLIAEKSQRPIYIYWGGDDEEVLYLDALAREWDRDHSDIHYRPVLAKAGDDWKGRRGFVQDAAVADFTSVAGFEMYACGNPGMVHAAKDQMVANGMSEEHCYSDAFELAAPSE